MPKQQIDRRNFLRGMKPTYDPSVIPEDALWNIRNVRPDISGVLKLRPGSTSVIDSLGTGSIQGMIEAFDGLLVIFGQDLYHIDSTYTITTVDSTGALGATTSTKIDMIRSAVSGTEVAYIFSGGGIYETNDTTLSLVSPAGSTGNLLDDAGSQDTTSGPAKSTIILRRASIGQNYVAAGDPDSPNTVYFSEPLDITDWQSDSLLQLPDDGSKITGLANWYDALVIFRDTDIWAFFGTSGLDADGVLTLQDASVGCRYRRTIQAVPSLGLVFLGQDNVYNLAQVEAIESQTTAMPIGDDIRNFLEVSIEEEDEPCAVYHNRDYILSFPEATERIYRLSLQNEGGWFMDTGPRSTEYVVWDEDLYAASFSQGLVRRISKDYYEDDGNPIIVQISFRREELIPGPSRIKKIFIYLLALGREDTETVYYHPLYDDQTLDDSLVSREVDILSGTEQNLQVSVLVDGNTFDITEYLVESGRVESSTLARVRPVKIYEARFHPSLKGHYMQLRIESTADSQDIAILGYGVNYSTRGRQHGDREGVTQ